MPMQNPTPAADFYTAGGKVNAGLTGGGTVSYDPAGNLSWSQRFISIGGGRGLAAGVYSTVGYYDIGPSSAIPVGTVIPGVGGATSITTTAAGIQLTQWGALYYKLNGFQFVPINLIFVGHTSDYAVTADMVMIAAVNIDAGNNTIRLGTGQVMQRGSIIKTDSVTVGVQTAATDGAMSIGPNILNIGSPTKMVTNAIAAPETALRLYRAGTSGVKYNASADLQIGTYGAGGAAQTNIKFRLGASSVHTPDVDVLEIRADGRVTLPIALPNYVNSQAAVADTALPPGSLYTVPTASGAKNLFIK